MPLFAYEAINNSGFSVVGKLEADSELNAAVRLRKTGYTIIDVAEVRQSGLRKAFEIRRKVGVGDLSFFSRQLSAMLMAGIPLTRCLNTLHLQAGNPTLAQTVGEVTRSVESGASLSESLVAYPDIFSPIYVDMVRAGEISGSLEEMLGHLSGQLEREKSLRDNIRSATIYPLVIICFAFCVMLAMMFFIVPIFMKFYPSGMALPLSTRVIVTLSDSLRGYWYAYLAVFLFSAAGLRFYLAGKRGRAAWETVKFRLPVFGQLLKKVAIARFTRILSILLAGGIPVLQALDAAGPASGSTRVMEVVKQAGADIQEGQSIASPLEQSGFFPPIVTSMVAVGEESGQISALLEKVAEFYEEEVASVTKSLTSLIEPILIIMVGCVIGAIVIAVYLPVFSIVTQMGN